MFGALGANSATFVAPIAIENGIVERLELAHRVLAVGDTRTVGKRQMPLNDACPEIRVDASAFTVTIDGELIEPAPMDELPLAQRYSLF
jgi:urease subunit alpha